MFDLVIFLFAVAYFYVEVTGFMNFVAKRN